MDLNLQLGELLEEGLSARLFSGVSAAVITPVHGLISISKGTHAFDDPKPVTEHSLFDLASVSKTIVAAAIISLVEDGLLDPDEPIAPSYRQWTWCKFDYPAPFAHTYFRNI